MTAVTAAGLAPARKSVLQRRVRLVVSAVIASNVVEAGVAILAGRAASSMALVSFGLDSCVEVLSAAAIAWQFAGHVGLASYYTERGESPGSWIGSGMGASTA